MNGSLERDFTRWLFRPYFDLASAERCAPFHLAGIEFSFRSFVEDAEYPRIQACFNPSFRKVLLRQTASPEYDVGSPLGLPEHLQSTRWQTLCAGIRSFPDLSCRAKSRVAWTLSKLCLQRAAVDLIPPSSADRIAESSDHAALAFVRCYSRYRMHVDDVSSPYSIDEFKRLAVESPPGITHIDSAYQVVVQNVKHTGDLQEVETWQKKHREAIEQSRSELDHFGYIFALSRYHRVGGFIPQMRGDSKAIVAEMDLSEYYALELPRSDDVHRVAADEVLYPVLESRTREALWLDDHELALVRATRAVELTPNDSRAWMLLGEVYLAGDRPQDALTAYRKAVRFAPPGGEVAWFMLAQCHEALDDLESACNGYLHSLAFDPFGISAAEELEATAARLGQSTILNWVREHLAHLRSLEANTTPSHRWPYKELPPPLSEMALPVQQADGDRANEK